MGIGSNHILKSCEFDEEREESETKKETKEEKKERPAETVWDGF